VVTPQRTSAATSNGIQSWFLTTEFILATVYCENVPSVHMAPAVSPEGMVNGYRPSAISPIVPLSPPSQRLDMPRAQEEHLPQAGLNDPTTWSPGATCVTPSPAASTTPAPSCPPTIASRPGRSPPVMCTSERHRPATVPLASPLPWVGAWSSQSMSSYFPPSSRATAAVVFIGLPPGAPGDPRH